MEEILKQIALENRTTVGSVKKEIEFAIHEAMNNSQTDSKNFWNELSSFLSLKYHVLNSIASEKTKRKNRLSNCKNSYNFGKYK